MAAIRFGCLPSSATVRMPVFLPFSLMRRSVCSSSMTPARRRFITLNRVPGRARSSETKISTRSSPSPWTAGLPTSPETRTWPLGPRSVKWLPSAVRIICSSSRSSGTSRRETWMRSPPQAKLLMPRTGEAMSSSPCRRKSAPPRDGKRPRPRLDGEVQLIDHRAEQRARAEDFDLGVGRRLLAEDVGQVVQARDALGLVLDLEQRIRAVDGGCEEEIEARQQHGARGHRRNQHAALEDGADVLA